MDRPAPRSRHQGTLLASKPSQTIRMQSTDRRAAPVLRSADPRKKSDDHVPTVAGGNATSTAEDATMSRTPFCVVGAGRAGCSAGAFDSVAQQSDCGLVQQWHFDGADSEPHVTRPPAGAKRTPRQITRAAMALHTRIGSDVFISRLKSHSRAPFQSDIPPAAET
jgi:hypothetical protein